MRALASLALHLVNVPLGAPALSILIIILRHARSFLVRGKRRHIL
jgi:hypothetical protein